MLGGVNYVLVTEDTEDDEAGFLILKETPDEEDEEYSIYDIVEEAHPILARSEYPIYLVFISFPCCSKLPQI